MIHLLLLALVPYLAHAVGVSEWQRPLPKPPGGAKCGRGRKGPHYGSAYSFHVRFLLSP